MSINLTQISYIIFDPWNCSLIILESALLPYTSDLRI